MGNCLFPPSEDELEDVEPFRKLFVKGFFVVVSSNFFLYSNSSGSGDVGLVGSSAMGFPTSLSAMDSE